MDDYERVLLVKPDVHVYKIPPRVSNRAYRASDWNLDAPDWCCRLRLISKGDECYIKLDEKSTGQFFGKCPIDKYPGTAVEPVSDSSRYFVLRLLNEQTGRTAFIGIGFVDRSDSFDLNVALQDHFKSLDLENKLGDNNTEDNTPKLDLKFKEGQTIKVNLNLGNKSCSKPRPKPMSSANKGMSLGILLPPPPGSLNKSSNRENNASPDLFDHSESIQQQQQQKVLDDLESLNISNGSSLLKSSDNDGNGDDNAKLTKTSVPVSTAENTSNIDWVDFKSSSSTITTTSNIALLNDNDNSPFSSNNTNTKPLDSGSNQGDLWSDFTSCNNNSSNTTTNTTKTPDDWAKFF